MQQIKFFIILIGFFLSCVKVQANEVCDGATLSLASCLSKQVALQDKVIQVKNSQIVMLVDTVYGKNNSSGDGLDYVNDSLSLKYWMSYRDATCYAESYIMGMSTSEITKVSQSCRLSMTKKN